MRLSLIGFSALAGLSIAQSNADLSQQYVPSPGSPGFYAGNSSAAVTFDQHSLLLDGKRVMIFSGEFYPWRLPSTPLWRDVFEKMKQGSTQCRSRRQVMLSRVVWNERESKVIISEHPFWEEFVGVLFCRVQVTTWTTLNNNKKPYPPLIIAGSPSIAASIFNGTTLIPDPRVGGRGGRYGLSPRSGSVLVFDPYLVWNATIRGDVLAITGDLKSGMTELEVLASRSVTFNCWPVGVSKLPTGTLQGWITVRDLTLKLPSLNEVEWRCTGSLGYLKLHSISTIQSG
ncbi:hypothetical protein B0J17DRAFT_724134 [Rhizoctonia solani]|nr:hypothetical protein B0J17DRAFT_724134 [Rhizoctonia solani]